MTRKRLREHFRNCMNTNYKHIELLNFDSIRNTILNQIECINLPHQDGVFPHVGDVDVHAWMQSIPSLCYGVGMLGLYNYWVASAVVLTYKEIPIHKDNAHEFDYSLILPILNVQDTYTCFYNCSKDPETRYLPNGLPYDSYAESSCTLIDRVEITSPILLNVKTPHGVTIGEGVTPRVTIALRLNNA